MSVGARHARWPAEGAQSEAHLRCARLWRAALAYGAAGCAVAGESWLHPSSPAP